MLELLVAFVIMAMSLGALYQASGGSVRAVGDSQRHQQAAMLAESLLAMHDAVPEAGWNEDGRWEDYAWSVRSQPAATGREGPGTVVLHRVEMDVAWQDGERTRHLTLATLLPQRLPPIGSAP